MNLLIGYLLIGLVVAFLLEHLIRWANETVTFGERLWSIILWPIMVVVFIYNYIKGFMDGLNNN
jgi:flagellar biosynthesis protein FliQ